VAATANWLSQTKASKAQDAARQLKARQIATDINLLHGTLSSTAIAELHLSHGFSLERSAVESIQPT